MRTIAPKGAPVGGENMQKSTTNVIQTACYKKTCNKITESNALNQKSIISILYLFIAKKNENETLANILLQYA